MPDDEPLTLENAIDILRSWLWFYGELERPNTDTDAQVVFGAAKGRNRQCSIGYHEECSDRTGVNWNGDCECPCHKVELERVGVFMRWMDSCLSALSLSPSPQPEERPTESVYPSQEKNDGMTVHEVLPSEPRISESETPDET